MSDLVGNSNCWFSHAQAHIIYRFAVQNSPTMTNVMNKGVNFHGHAFLMIRNSASACPFVFTIQY